MGASFRFQKTQKPPLLMHRARLLDVTDIEGRNINES